MISLGCFWGVGRMRLRCLLGANLCNSISLEDEDYRKGPCGGSGGIVAVHQTAIIKR